MPDPTLVENAGRYGATAFGWWRTDLPLEQGFRYWRDVHGPLAARIPGLFQYRQRHLGPIEESTWPAIPGVDLRCPADEQPHGSAELLFLSADDQALFASSSFVTEHIFNDERNLALRNVTYMVASGNCHTLVDATGRPVPQGGMPDRGWMVCLKRCQHASEEAFRRYLRDELAPRWAEVAGVVRVRLTLLEPYDAAGWQSPAVLHDWERERQYHAWLDLVVSDVASLGELAKTPGIAEHVRALHAFPVREQYTLVYDGRPTDVGLRGWPAVEVIEAAAANNQRDPALLEAIYGPVARGAAHVEARRELLGRYFDRQNAMDLDGWLDLLTDDVKVLIPFAPANFPQVVDGKAAVADIYGSIFAGYTALRVDVHEVQLALDPGFATVRWHTHADLRSGGAYDNELIGTFRFRDGRIYEIGEYFNTMNFLEAIAGI